MGRVHKPLSHKGGNPAGKGGPPSLPWKGAGRGFKEEQQAVSESEESQDNDDDEELVPDRPTPEKPVLKHDQTPALDEDSDGNEGAVPDFMFDQR